ncbi:MAG: DUF2062 domain-containing protein [Dehalococcoidia bacterium]|nr:DUF2062 domain-containing protein [Dehalococcoidia bacterium]
MGTKNSFLGPIGDYLHPASIKKRLQQALSLGDPPEKIAMGVAVGIFLGVFPTFNLGIILAVVGARFFKYNVAASIAGSAVATPLTSPFIIIASAALGSLITGTEWGYVAEQAKGEQFWDAAWTTALTYMAGNLILCAVSSIPAYFITKRAVVEYRQRRGVATS